MIDVQALKLLFNDDVLVQKYLIRFNEDMPKLLAQIRSAYTAEQWNELSIHAHSYRSQLQYIHEPVVAAMAYDLEKLSESQHIDGDRIEELITQLENQWCIMLLELKEIIE